MATKRDRVEQCIIDLTNQRRTASRPVLAQLLNWPLREIDECVKQLKELERIRPVAPGIFVPVQQFPEDRAITTTDLPDGSVQFELGDQPMLTFTPHEAQVVGRKFAGYAQSLMYWEQEQQTGDQLAQARAEIRRLQTDILHLRERMDRGARMPRQPRESRQGDMFHPTGRPRARART